MIGGERYGIGLLGNDRQVSGDNAMKELAPLHVVVRFGSGVSGDVQARSLLEFERVLRRMMPGEWPEVFKDIMGDDSKLRNLMTPEQRNKL